MYALRPEHKKNIPTPPLVHWQLAASMKILDRLSSFLYLASYTHHCWLSDDQLVKPKSCLSSSAHMLA